jgi:hypothetical protein
MCQFTRFMVGAAVGSVVWMTSMWASAAEKGAKQPKCTFSEVNGTVVISCTKPPVICHYEKLANGKPGEMVLVCEGGLPGPTK